MAFLKKHIVFLVLLLLVYSVYLVTQTLPHHNVQVLGTQANLALFEEPKDGRTPLLSALQNAHSEILVEVYLLSDKQIIQALDDAENRHVGVKVMLEQHPFGGGSTNNKTYHELQAMHIPVEWTSNTFALTHEKAVVIDNTEVFILNQNLTTSSFSKNREYDIFDTNADDVKEIRNMFVADWERNNFVPTDDNLVISPVTARDKLTALIQSANKNIVLEIEDINDTHIVDTLSEKAKIMPVEIITPTLSQVASNKDALDTLQQAGAKIKMVSSPYIHAKMIVVDNTKAYVGSINLSSQSMDENREVGILISQQDIVNKLSQDFAADWNN